MNDGNAVFPLYTVIVEWIFDNNKSKEGQNHWSWNFKLIKIRKCQN